MSIIEPILMGFDQIRLHKLRATLSILGILISVGSLTGIVSMGDGLRITVMRQFEQMGGPSSIQVREPNMWYRSDGRWVQRDWDEHLTNLDVEYFETEIEDIKYVVPIREGNYEARYREAVAYARMRCTTPEFIETMNWNVAKGRFINDQDVKLAAKVAVIGSELAKDLYGQQEPVGRELKIQGIRFLVVGVLGDTKFMGNTNERNVVVPITTAQKRYYGNQYLGHLTVMATSPDKVQLVASRIRSILKRQHLHGEDFRVITGEEEIGQFNRIVLIMKIVAGGIAGISLLVGGIGIMNIMLVTVTERTREIGIRMALGATRRSILAQFVLEAIVLCLFGGILGIILGMSIGAGITALIKNLTPAPFVSIITPELMAFALLYSAGIGLFFGVYPAWRASKLDPVEALRYE